MNKWQIQITEIDNGYLVTKQEVIGVSPQGEPRFKATTVFAEHKYDVTSTVESMLPEKQQLPARD